jgi:diguanylate cyclase (GGDEF)-like protein
MDRKLEYDESDERDLTKDLVSEDREDGFEIISPVKKAEVGGFVGNRFTPFGEKLVPPDLKERYEEIANEPISPDLDSGGKFSFALEKILSVLNDVFAPYSVIFFWYDKKSQKLSLHKFLSKSNDILVRKFEIEDDILSKIVQTSEPQLLSDILPNAEYDNIRYYEKPQGIKSFVGVPVFYESNLIAIIALDSKAGDSFGIETIYSLGRFIRVITLLIQIFEERHREHLSQKRLNALLNFLNVEFAQDSYDNVINSISETFKEFFEWDLFSIVFYDRIEKCYKIIKLINNTNLKYVGEGFNIELNGTVVGKSISNNNPTKIDDIGIEKIYRYNKSEDITGFGSFMCIPITVKDKPFGALCFESLKSNHFTNSDIRFIESVAKFSAYVLDNVYSKKMMERLISLDIETMVLNENAFKQRLQEELFKAKSVEAKGVLALIKIDDFLEQSSLFDGDPFNKVLKEILSIIKKELNPYVIFGRISDRVFAAHFFNHEMKNVFIWAEKLRVKIARNPIPVGMRQNTYTISVGLCSTTGKTDISEVLENAELTLRKAVEKGGNTVTQ